MASKNSRPLSEPGDLFIQQNVDVSDKIRRAIENVNESSDLIQMEADILNALGLLLESAQAYAQVGLPVPYQDGIDIADNILSQINFSSGDVDPNVFRESQDEMFEDFQLDYGSNMQIVRKNTIIGFRNARKTMQKTTDALNQAIPRRKRVEDVKNILRSFGARGLVDAAGRTWALDNYADMLVRTYEIRGFNQAMTDLAQQANIVVYRVSFTGTDHDSCKRWESKNVSEDGQFGLPTKQQAVDAGLLHPRCTHTFLPDPRAQEEFEAQ